MATKRKITYSEPEGYFPKEIRDKILKAGAAKKTTKKSTSKTTKKK